MRRFLILTLLVSLLSLALAYPITIVDDAGRLVTIARKPERVVCAAPSTTKFLQYLGLEDKIVAVTNWDDFEAERIGDLFPLNLEKILSLNPDIVLTFGGFQLPEVPKLEQQGLTAVVLNANTIQQILNDLVLVGTIMGVPEKAKKACERSSRILPDRCQESLQRAIRQKGQSGLPDGYPRAGR